MTVIGAGWKKQDKNGKAYISISIDKELLPLQITEDKKISIFPIGEKQNEKAPDFRVVMFLPEEKAEETKNNIWD